jgi:hypothetical protein
VEAGDLRQAAGEVLGLSPSGVRAVAYDLVEQHLRGSRSDGGPFVAGVYPLLQDDTCWFLAADFDKADWKRDVLVFARTARGHGVPVAIERSRSGNGAHA